MKQIELKNGQTRDLYTLEELSSKGLIDTTIISTVIDPEHWYYTLYPDGHYWPYDKIN